MALFIASVEGLHIVHLAGSTVCLNLLYKVCLDKCRKGKISMTGPGQRLTFLSIQVTTKIL